MMARERGVLNRRLAELLGWKRIESAGVSLLGTPPWWAGNSRGQAAIPDWERSWEACGALMVRHGCFPEVDADFPSEAYSVDFEAGAGSGRWSTVSVLIAHYASADDAARAAVISGVIAKLEASKR